MRGCRVGGSHPNLGPPRGPRGHSTPLRTVGVGWASLPGSGVSRMCPALDRDFLRECVQGPCPEPTSPRTGCPLLGCIITGTKSTQNVSPQIRIPSGSTNGLFCLLQERESESVGQEEPKSPKNPSTLLPAGPSSPFLPPRGPLSPFPGQVLPRIGEPGTGGEGAWHKS